MQRVLTFPKNKDLGVAIVPSAIMTQDLRRDPSGNLRAHRTLDIFLNDNPQTIYGNANVLEFEIKQAPITWLRFWEPFIAHLESGIESSISYPIASPENPILAPAGGSIPVFVDEDGNPRYVTYNQKDNAAPRDKLCRAPRNGFPQSLEDSLTNAHIIRESFEEGLVLSLPDEDGKRRILVPQDPQYDALIAEVARTLEEKTKLKTSGIQRIPMRFRGGPDTIRIHYKGKQVLEDSGIITVSYETGTNFIKPLEVKMPLDQVTLLDGETFPNGEPIKRDVCAIDLRELVGKTLADPIHERVYHHDGNNQVSVYERNDFLFVDRVGLSLLSQGLLMQRDGSIVINEGQPGISGKPLYPLDWVLQAKAIATNPKVMLYHAMKCAGAIQWSSVAFDLSVDAKYRSSPPSAIYAEKKA